MAGKEKQGGKMLYKCNICNTQNIDSCTYISHIKSKRHLKNLKDRNVPQPNDESNRTIQVTGYSRNTPVDEVIQVFLKYGVRLVTPTKTVITIEFHSAEGARKALEAEHICQGAQLQASPLKYTKHNAGRRSVPVSPRTWNRLRGRTTKDNLNRLIFDLISDIEIKSYEYEKREYLRKIMVRFLIPHFPKVYAFIFGSSANNLGFTGCDVDLYVDLGVYPWASGYSRAESQAHASNLTWYLAREIRNTRRGIQVQAVPRARVPIVKFKDTSTGMFVDLSFRHNMPVYNTKLIYQCTKTHILVRPYMMLIRCWAKIQDVAGGGEPSWLITNYALSMMMIFYLMTRNDPIIPSVSSLKMGSANPNSPDVIDGWDCSFSGDVSDWINRVHNVTIIELVAEFFEFYGNLEAAKWVISPYAGMLIEKADIKERDMRRLPSCMLPYCQQRVDIQMNTPLCVQDIFELSHNCTRGLKKGPLTEFQYKCSVAAQVCWDVAEGKQSLSDLLEVIEVTPANLETLRKVDSGTEKAVEKLQEVITLDDSNTSQDSIEVLEEAGNEKVPPTGKSGEEVVGLNLKLDEALAKNDETDELVGKFKKTDNITVKNKVEEVSMKSSESDIEVLTETVIAEEEVSVIKEIKGIHVMSASAAQATENGVSDSDMDTGTGPREFLENVPKKRPLKCVLSFSDVPEFSITFDGAVSGNKNIMTSEDDIAQAACSLTHFVLQQCLKIEVSVIEDFLGCKKRKSLESEVDTDSAKRLKAENGECIPVPTKYRRLAQYKCSADVQLWIGRKKVTKTVLKASNATPLQHELAITEVQLESHDSWQSGTSTSIDCLIEVWQKCNNSSYILLTGKSLSEENLIKGNVIQMYSYLTSLIQNLLKKVTQYVHATSSKR